MRNPHNINVKNQRHIDWEAGAKAEREGLRATGFHITEGVVLEIDGRKLKATKNQTLILLPDDD